MTGEPSGRSARHLLRVRNNEGFALVELMVVLAAFAVLLAITVPIVSTVLQTTSQVRNTYTNLNSQLSLSTTLQRLLRAAVAPAPSFESTTPVPPFKLTAIGPTSLTFFANTGTANGPEEVTASCTQTASDKALCARTATFTLTVTPAKKATCPFEETTTKSCTWSTSSKRTVYEISHVTNSDSSPAQTLFTYTCTSGTCASTTFTRSHCSHDASYTADRPFTTCPAGEIDEISYELTFDAKPTKSTPKGPTPRNGGSVAQTISGTFVMSSTSDLFSPVVG